MTYEELFMVSEFSKLILGDLRDSMAKIPRDESLLSSESSLPCDCSVKSGGTSNRPEVALNLVFF